MRILLDLQGCQLADEKSSFGNYSRKLAKALLQRGDRYDFWLAMNSRLPNISKLRQEFEPYIAWHQMLVFDIPGPVALRDRKNSWRNSAAKLIRQAFIEHVDPDIVFLSDPLSGFDDDAVTTIADRQAVHTISAVFNLSPLLHEKSISTRWKTWRHERIKSLGKAKLLLVKSETDRKTAETQFGLDPERIISIPEIRNRQKTTKEAERLGAPTTESTQHSLVAHASKQEQKFSWAIIADHLLEEFKANAQEETSCSKLRGRHNAKQMPTHGVARQTLYTALRNIKETIGPTLADLAASAACIATNDATSSKPRIFVDVSAIRATDLHTGIQRVVKNILNHINKIENTEFIVQTVYICKETEEFLYDKTYTTLSGDTKKIEGTAIIYGNNDIFLGLDLSSVTPHHGRKRLQEMRERGMRIFFVIYDLLPIHYPDFFPEGVSRGFTSWLQSVTELADGMICISKAVADELIEWLTKNQSDTYDHTSKIGFFHLGSDIEKHPAPTETSPECHDIPRPMANSPYLLMVGTLEPRKGHAQAIAAFDLLWQQGVDINLVIVGKPGWKVEALIKKLNTHKQSQKRLFWFNQASDALLLKLYENASGLLVTSECEGFGLPLIEAARHKVPVIARDLPVFKEIGGEHAYFFDGKAPEDLANAVQNWLELKAHNEIPYSDNIRCLTWEESAAQLLDVLMKGKWLYNWPSNRNRVAHSRNSTGPGISRRHTPPKRQDSDVAVSP